MVTECEKAKARQKSADAATRLAANLAAALRAYQLGAAASAACTYTDGTGALCSPSRADAAYNFAWETFKSL
jgi:hypothetical protein